MEESVLKALLEEGIAAAQAGQKERARQCLMQVVEADENNEQAWLWLSGVMEGLEDKQVCLENVLALNPDSDLAKRGLAWIAQQRVEQSLPPVSPSETPAPVAFAAIEPEPSPPDISPAPPPPTSVTPSTEGPPDQVIAPPAQPPPAPSSSAAFPAVRYERRRKRESRSAVLWLLSIGWGLYGLLCIAAGVFVLFLPSWLSTLLEQPDLVAELQPDQIETLMTAVETGAPWGIGLIVFGGLGIALTVGLLMRLKEAFYASFVMAALTLVASIYSAVAGGGGCCCGPIIPIVFLGLAFFARDDFAMEEVTVEERVEYPPGSPLYHYNLGAAYIKQKKLDLAIQEWEQAVKLEPDNLRFRNALALAHAGQGQKEKAVALLEETLALAPDDAETKSNLEAVQKR